MGFQTPQIQLEDLLTEVESGVIQLPDFQREYRWDDDRIRDLLVTVLRGHPMGVLMLLDTANNNVHFQPRPLERVEADASAEHRVLEQPTQLLLDGQQRMTSMYQALRGSGVVDTKDSRGKHLRRRYFLDIERALESAEEQSKAIVSVPEDGMIRSNIGRTIDIDVSSTAKEVVVGLMPVTRIFNDSAPAWLLEYARAISSDQVVDQHRFDILNEFVSRVLPNIKKYVIPAIRLDSTTTKEAVATVFNKVNQGGLPLDNFELLTAIFAGDKGYFDKNGEYFRLRDDWKVVERVLRDHPVLSGFREVDFLQSVLLLASRERHSYDVAMGKDRPRAITGRGDDVLGLTLDEYLHWAPKVRDALSWTARFYTSLDIHERAFLPYPTLTVPLTVYRVILGADIDVHTVSERIRNWYWCGVLGELYGSTTETRVARDVEQVPLWALAAKTGEEAPVPKTVAESVFQESRLLSLRTRRAAAYKGIYALLIADGAKDWRLDQKIDHASYLEMQIDIHHIFPRSWCNKVGINADLRESIVNKTPLAKKTNILLRGDSPAVYLPRLESESGLTEGSVNTLLAAHHINPNALRNADFDLFFDCRLEALISLIETAMGKRVFRDLDQGAEEGPSAFEDEPEDEVLAPVDDEL